MVKIIYSFFALIFVFTTPANAQSEPSTEQSETCLSALTGACKDADTFWTSDEKNKFYSLAEGAIYSCRLTQKSGPVLYKISRRGADPKFRSVTVSDIGGAIISPPMELEPAETKGAKAALCNVSTSNEAKESLGFHISRIAARCNLQLKREPAIKPLHSRAFAKCQDNGLLNEFPKEATAPATGPAKAPTKK